MNESENTAAAREPEELPPHAQIIQMANGYILSQAVRTAAELGVADHLGGDPLTADELAAKTGAHAPSLYRLMRSLSAFGVFEEDDDRRFSLTPLGAALRSDAPGAARSTIRVLGGPTMWGAWNEFPHSVKTGETGVQKAFGKPFFEHLGEHPEEATLFNEAMIGIHGAEPPAVAAAYDFSEIGKLVDVGGGTGNLLTTILLAHPHLEGLLFDLPQTAGEARAAIAEKGLAERCTVEAGDFFEAVPAGGDAYILSHIIHDWNEEQCVQILRNCRAAMGEEGRLLLVEMVVPPGNEFHPSKMLDLIMLAVAGGMERTEEEYAALYEKAGFELTRIVPTASPVSVVEGRPR